MIRTVILGSGHYVPSKVVTNDDLAKIFPTSDEWIQQRTGVKERHYIDFQNDPMDGCELGIRAARQALDAAGAKPEDVDLLIWGTLSPDHQFPGNAAWAQPRLGLKPGTPVMDIRNQCSYLVYALTVADAMIKTGQFKKVLVIGSEIHSTGMEFAERGRDVTVIFGDGAGALLLGASDDPNRGILATDIHADGSFAPELATLMGSANYPTYVTHEVLDQGLQFPKMNGKLVFKHAVTKMPESIHATLAKVGLRVTDLDLLICHQANLRISEFVQKTLELPDDKVYNNIQKYGNTTAASILIALDECIRAEKLKRGQLVCLTAFGAGFTWGSAVIRY